MQRSSRTGWRWNGAPVRLTYEKEVTRRGSNFHDTKVQRETPHLLRPDNLQHHVCRDGGVGRLVHHRETSLSHRRRRHSFRKDNLHQHPCHVHQPNAKIVSIEDTSEIQLPHENWLSSVVRMGFGVTGEVSEITLFDLLKNAMSSAPSTSSSEKSEAMKHTP